MQPTHPEKDGLRKNLMKLYENSLPPGVPRAKLFKVFMRGHENAIEEKCPTGCEEDVYERVLQLRTKRRELEATKVEAMKESEEAKTILDEKVKEMEVAVATWRLSNAGQVEMKMQITRYGFTESLCAKG